MNFWKIRRSGEISHFSQLTGIRPYPSQSTSIASHRQLSESSNRHEYRHFHPKRPPEAEKNDDLDWNGGLESKFWSLGGVVENWTGVLWRTGSGNFSERSFNNFLDFLANSSKKIKLNRENWNYRPKIWIFGLKTWKKNSKTMLLTSEHGGVKFGWNRLSGAEHGPFRDSEANGILDKSEIYLFYGFYQISLLT